MQGKVDKVLSKANTPPVPEVPDPMAEARRPEVLTMPKEGPGGELVG